MGHASHDVQYLHEIIFLWPQVVEDLMASDAVGTEGFDWQRQVGSCAAIAHPLPFFT